jgi:hypothetical protein
VYGISSDSPAANKAFAESQRLPFPLLTDPAGALRKVGGGAGNSAALLACVCVPMVCWVMQPPMLAGRRASSQEVSQCRIAMHPAPPESVYACAPGCLLCRALVSQGTC